MIRIISYHNDPDHHELHHYDPHHLNPHQYDQDHPNPHFMIHIIMIRFIMIRIIMITQSHDDPDSGSMFLVLKLVS